MPRLTHQRRTLAGVDPKLLITLGVLAVVGLGVWIWTSRSNDVGEIGSEQRTYYCVFDDGEAHVSMQELYTWQSKGDAIISRDMGGIPTRVRCPICGNPSCIRADPETGEEIEVDESWDFKTWDNNAGGRSTAQ